MIIRQNGRIFVAFLGVLIALLIGLAPNRAVLAQVEFDPEHPEVRKMALDAVNYLTVNPPGGTEELILAALAITECTKRYDNMVPVDHPVVVRAIAAIMEEINADRTKGQSLFSRNKVYVPALACILLCDVNDELYKDQIVAILRELESRQGPFGGFGYLADKKGVGDTSQIQYIGLAFYVAHHHGFKVNLFSCKKAVEWLAYSNQGYWWYRYLGNPSSHTPWIGPSRRPDTKVSLSIHAAGAGTLYLLSDFLQLSPRAGRSAAGKMSTGLPPSVSIYVKPAQEGGVTNKKGPLVSADTGSIAAAKRRANQFFGSNFSINTKKEHYNYYYLYALERYGYFRERADGEFKEQPTWYDQGVYYLKKKVRGDGGFQAGPVSENRKVATSFAILFLVRSSEVLVLPSNASRANGNQGFVENVRIKQGEKGTVQALEGVQGIENVMQMLQNGDVEDDRLELIVQSMGPAIASFSKQEGKSRNEKMAFMRGLVTEKNYFRRLIGVKFLAREQEMDNVPALLYALGDPDLRICREAHNGLRLISRKLNSIKVPDNANKTDFETAKDQWTEWFLKIRPGAELLD